MLDIDSFMDKDRYIKNTRQEEVRSTFVPPASSSILNKLNFGLRRHVVLRCGYPLQRCTNMSTFLF